MKNVTNVAIVLAASLCSCADEPERDKGYDVVLEDTPGVDVQKAYAVMNCNTGSCTCYNMTSSTCTTACDILWDENCSKPASEQP